MDNKKIKIPEPLKKYVIQDIDKRLIKKNSIAKGGQGTVWLAVDDQNKEYAIKEIFVDLKNPIRQIKRYLLECASLMRAQHPFIITFCGMTDKYPFQIVTEYVGPVNLTTFLTNKHFRSQSNNGTHLTKIAIAITNAMMFLHKINIIHRDLKPSNILIGNDFLPRICDFGLIHDTDQKALMTAELGTPIWMAPEVIRGEYYTEKCDVFSFAMILFQMATKELPMSQLTSTAIMEKYKNEGYRPSFPKDTKIPDPLKKLITSCWNENPKERPSFNQIFDKFANGEVSFSHHHPDTVKQFVKQLKEDDQKRSIIPPFGVFTYKKDDENNTEKKKKKKSTENDSKSDNDYSSNENRKKRKNNKNQNKRSTNKRKPKKVDDESEESYSENNDDDDDYNIKNRKNKKKTIKINDTDESSESNARTKRKIKKISNKKYNSESDSIPRKNKNKKQTRKKHYSDEIIDDKNEVIFDIDTFVTENRQKSRLNSSINRYRSFSNSDENRNDVKRTSKMPQFKTHLTRDKKRRPAPELNFSESSSYSYNNSTDNSYEYKKRKSANSKYYPIDSPRFASNSPVSIETLNDIHNPMFRIELEKVKKKDFPRFIKVLKNHLTSMTPHQELILLLNKTNELLEDDNCLSLFSEKKIFEFLPITSENNSNGKYYNDESNSDSDDINEHRKSKHEEILDISIEILNKVCQFYPQYIDEDFETTMLSLINVRPIEASNFLYLYSKSFEMIENPWPLLDMLIVQKKKFNKSEAGSIVVKTLVKLIQNHKNFKKSRLANCRSVITFFLNSPVKKNVLSAYKALIDLYDNKFDLPFKKIRIDMDDNELVDSVISLFERMDNIPSTKSIIFSLLKIAHKNENASNILIKMANDYDSASILINYMPDWMKEKLPTFAATMRIFISATSNFRDLQKRVVSDSVYVADLFSCLCKYEKNEESFLLFKKVFNQINFNSEFLENLQEKKFFGNFFRGIVEIDDDRVTLSCLRAFEYMIDIGFCDEYFNFNKTLRKLSSRDDKIGDEAQYCIDMLNPPKRKRKSGKKS